MFTNNPNRYYFVVSKIKLYNDKSYPTRKMYDISNFKVDIWFQKILFTRYCAFFVLWPTLCVAAERVLIQFTAVHNLVRNRQSDALWSQESAQYVQLLSNTDPAREYLLTRTRFTAFVLRQDIIYN